MEIYLDIVFILNFLVDFLLIMGTNSISGYPLAAGRAAMASLAGAGYAAVCVVPGFEFLSGGFWRIVSFFFMSVAAFGWNYDAIRRGALFVFLSMALGGIALGIGNGGFWAIVMSAVGVCLLCVLGFPRRPGQQHYVAVQILHGGKRASLTALLDTGNTLRDPVSGWPVLVADQLVAEKLLALSADQLLHPIETIASRRYPGLRLIPYSAVGQSAGMLLGLRVEHLMVNGKKENMIVAFAPQKIGKGRPYQALAGGMV